MSNPRDNNFREVNAKDFVEIVKGNDRYHIFGNASSPYMLQVSEENYIRDTLEQGEIPSYSPVRIPAFWSKERWTQHNASMPVEHWPDFDKPLITYVKGNVYITTKYSTPRKTTTEASLVRGINIKDCIIDGSFSFYYTVSSSYIEINNFTVLKDDSEHPKSILSFSNSTFSQCTLENLKSTENSNLDILTINNVSCKNIIIKNSKINLMTFDGLCDIDEITIENCLINDLFIKSKLKNINIHNCNISSSLNFSEKFKKINIINSEDFRLNPLIKIHHLSISYKETDKESKIYVDGLNIDYFLCTSINSGDSLIKNCEIQTFALNDFTNLNVFKIHNIHIKSKFELIDASMGKAELINIKFNKECKIEITDSNISDIVIMNTQFHDKIISSTNGGTREIYRQLKYNAYKQNDRINELYYEAIEINKFQTDKNIRKNWGDKFILLTNRFSNNHGQDWRYAAIELLFITTFSFTAIKHFTNYEIAWGFPSNQDISQYMNFAFNPLHDFDKIFSNKSQNLGNFGTARLIDSVAKIFSGYLIIQFLRAFRKYVK